jgi:hypothetical protein
MRTRSTPKRIAELTRWINKNKTAPWRDFVRETGGTQTQYYHVRSNLNLSRRNPGLSVVMKEVARRRADAKWLGTTPTETLDVTPTWMPPESLEMPADAPVETPTETLADKLTAMFKDNEQFLAGKEEPAPKKEEAVVEGNTPDFIWYEMDLLQKRLQSVSAGLHNVMSICQSRDREQKKMMHSLINENTTLRVENNSLKQQVMELTEMINGTSI